MNAVHLIGLVSDHGPKLTYTAAAKPQLTFTLTVEEPGRDGTTFKTFVPVVIVGAQAKPWAATLEAGRLVVTGFTVERLIAAAPAPTTGA